MTLVQHTIETEADTLQDARQKLNAQLTSDDIIIAERIVQDGDYHTIKTIADTTVEAFSLAETQVPGGVEIVEKNETISPERKVVEIEAMDESTATTMAKAQFQDSVVIKSIRLAIRGRKGFLGAGIKPNKYDVDVLQQSTVELRYRAKAKISNDICKHDDVKRLLKSKVEDERVSAACILLKSNNRAERLEVANTLRNKEQGLAPLFWAVSRNGDDEQHTISELFWHTLWHVASTSKRRIPDLVKSVANAKIDDPREQLSLFATSTAELLEGHPWVAEKAKALKVDTTYQLMVFQGEVKNLVRILINSDVELTPEQEERVKIVMREVFRSC